MEEDDFTKAMQQLEAQPEAGAQPAQEGAPELDLEGALAALDSQGVTLPEAPAEPAQAAAPAAEMTAEQKALTPGYYVEQGEPGLEPVTKVDEAVAGGALKSVFETQDFLFGETKEEDKTSFRKDVEANTTAIGEESGVNALASGIAQFTVGMIGLGKLGTAAKALPWVGRMAGIVGATKKGKVALETGKAALTGAIAFDPHEARLSNAVQGTFLANPVTEFLAAKPTDSASLGRLKSAMESIGMDAALIGGFTLAASAYRSMAHGDVKAAQREIADFEANVQQQIAAEEAGPPVLGQDNKRVIQSDNQNISRSQGIQGAEEVIPGQGSKMAIPAPGNGKAAPLADNANVQAPNIRADNDQPGAVSDGNAAVAQGEPRSGATTTGVKPVGPGNGKGSKFVASNDDASAKRGVDNDNSPIIGPERYKTTREGGQPANNGERAVGYNSDGQRVYEDAQGFRTVLDEGGVRVREPTPLTADERGKAKLITQDRKGTRWETEDEAAGKGNVRVEVTQNITSAKMGDSIVGASRAKPRIDYSDEDTVSIMTAARRDMDAIDQYGSKEAAIRNGHKFAVAGERIPWQKINTEEDRAALLARATEHSREDLDIMKGGAVRTDARSEQLVRQWAAFFNDDPEAAIAAISQAGKEAATMVPKMEAALLITRSMLTETADLSERFALGDFAEFGSKEAMIGEAKRRFAIGMEAYGSARSMTANMGRGLRRNRKEFAFTDEQMTELLNADGDRFMHLLKETKGNPKAMALLGKPAMLKRIGDWMQFLYVNNLVSGYTTATINMVSNLGLLAARPAERIIGGALQGNTAIVREGMKQYAYMASVLPDAFRNAGRAFLLNDSVLSPHSTELYAGATPVLKPMQYKPWDSVPNVLYNSILVATPKAVTQAIGLPTRSLGFVDELVKQTTYRSKVTAKEYVAALEQGTKDGLTGDGLSAYAKARAQAALDNAFDDLGRGTDPAAMREASIATLQQDLLPDTLGKGVQTLRQNVPGLRVILPFVKTPTNALRYGWKLSPGLNLLSTEYRGMLFGKDPELRAQAMGQMTLGFMFAGTAATMLQNGRVTGAGPKDYKSKSALMATGWRPYSFKTKNADGTTSYIPYNRFDPGALPFALVVDMMDAIEAHEGEESPELDDVIAAIGMSMSSQFSNKTYFQGISQVLDAISDPDENKWTSYIGGMAGNYVPFASMNRQLADDPYLRETRTMADKFLSTVPGMSETVPPRYDAFGDPVLARRGLHAVGTDDSVDDEVIRLGMEGKYVPTRVTPKRDGIDLREVTTSDGKNAYEVYQEYSGHLPGALPVKELVRRRMETEAYRNAPDGDVSVKGTKGWMVQGVLGPYRERAFKTLRRDPAVRKRLDKEELRVRALRMGKTPEQSNKGTLAGLLSGFGLGGN